MFSKSQLKFRRNKCFCGKPAFAKYGDGYVCHKHYYRWKKLGSPHKETVNDPNKIIIQKNISKIILKNKLLNIVGETIIDLDDLKKVKSYKWYLRKDDYASCSKLFLCLHQLIMGKKNGFEIDHINHNRLDNRKINLRFVTKQGNARNRVNIKGIRKISKKFQAYISIDGIQKHLGMFKNEKLAKIARLKAEQFYFN